MFPTQQLASPSHTFPPLAAQSPTPLPSLEPTATPLSCWSDGGTLVAAQIPSQILPEPLEVLIYLPPCFDALPEAKFPVVYLIHGQSFTQDQWVRLGAVQIADERIASRQVSPFLLVMPLVRDWREPTDVPFGQSLVEELIPYIEQTYRAQPGRSYRVIGGLSRGAAWALHLGLRYWQTFGAVGLHSLPIFFSDASQVPGWLDAIPLDEMPSIYLDYAVSDLSAIRRSTGWFMSELDDRGIVYLFSTSPGVHDEEYWSGQLEDYFQFYLQEW